MEITPDMIGKRGFSVVNMEDGSYVLYRYRVGYCDASVKETYMSLEMAIERGQLSITPFEKWEDITDQCSYTMSYPGHDNSLVATFEGQPINFDDPRYCLSSGRILRREMCYDQ